MARSKSSNKITDPTQALELAKRYLRSNLLDPVVGPKPAPIAEIVGADVIESAAADLEFWNGVGYADRLDYARVYCHLAAQKPKRADPVCYARMMPYADMVVGSLGYPIEQAKKVFESGAYSFDQMLQAAGAIEAEDFSQQRNYASSTQRFESEKREALNECFSPAINKAMENKTGGAELVGAVAEYLKDKNNARVAQQFYALLLDLSAQNILGLRNRAPDSAKEIAKIVAENCETTLSVGMLGLVQKVANGSLGKQVSAKGTTMQPLQRLRSSR